MPESFDPYHKWLGISPKDQPPNHYRLLGIELFESDPDVIEAAADQRMAHVRTYQTGQNSALSQKILNELSAAKLFLLDPKKKSSYDERLSRELALKAAQASKDVADEAPAEVVPLTELDVAVSSIESGMLTVRPSAAKGARRRKRSATPVILVGATILVSLPVVWLVFQANRDQAPKPNPIAKHQSDASSNRPTASAPEQVTPSPTKQVPQPAKAQTPVDLLKEGSADRQVAEEVLRRGGKLRLSVNGQSVEAEKSGAWPASDFRVVDVEMTRAQSDKVADLAFLTAAKHLEGLSLWNSRITAASLASLRGHASLKRLSVEDTRLPTGSLKGLLPLPKLEILLLANCDVTRQDLADLAGLKGLRVLGLQSAKIKDDDLRLLDQFPGLQDLHLSGVPVTDDGLATLAKVAPRLQTLIIPATKVTDDGLRHLTALKGLKLLDVAGNPQLSGSGLPWLTELPALEWLKIDQANITDDSLDAVAKLTALKTLLASNVPITDSGLKRLSSLTALEHLELNETGVTPAGVAELQKSLPKCRIAFSPTPRAVAETSPKEAPSGLLRIFDDEPEFVAALTSGDGKIEFVSDEAYSGQASVKVSPGQRFCEMLPGTNVKIRKKPAAPDEYRYLRFAWKKRGGGEIWLQLHYPSEWFRYHAGPKAYGWPGVRVTEELPTEFVAVTRDLAADFGEFTLTGFALTANDGEWAWFDHIYLARTLQDFDRITVPRRVHGSTDAPPARQLADLAAGSKSDVPDTESQRKARQELQKKYASELGAESPAMKRKLADKLLEKGAEAEKPDARAYVALQQARDLAESAADLDLAWQAIDALSRSFNVESLPLRQDSLTQVGKVARSPEQSRELADDACRLIAKALAAGRTDLVKKVASQAQSFAKRSKDAALVKAVASRAADALKLAGDYDGVAAARETLEAAADDPQANFTVGHYELCAAGEREAAIAKLAKGDRADWQKLASDDRASSRDRSTPRQQLALADAWWSSAEKEGWPGRHYLRMRSAEWYRRALPSLAGGEKTRAVERLKELLAGDEGLPAWELFDISRGEKFDTFVRIEPGGSLRTCVDYDGPLDIGFVARTDNLNVRLFVDGYPSVIWNWEVNPSELRVARPGGETIPVPVAPLEPNRWYALRYRITPQGTNITVDGASVFAEDHVYGKFPRSPVGVNGEGPAVIDVKKVVVKQF
jgi:hypothetical protein